MKKFSKLMQFASCALHVYRLAHGRRGKSNKEYYIVKKLKEQGVLTPTFYGGAEMNPNF